MENWKRIDMYEVSDYGQVFSHYSNKVLKPWKDKDGYLRVAIYKDGKHRNYFVHRIVWEVFNGKIPEGLVLDHCDGCKTNNCLNNLRCVTQKENCNNPVTRPKNTEALRNAHNKPVLQIDKMTGEVIRKWECSADVWRETGINYGNISECCNGKRKTASGYRWMFFMPPAVIYSQQGLGS